MARERLIIVINILLMFWTFVINSSAFAQSQDTLFLVFEDSEISNNGFWGGLHHYDSSSNFPYDMGRFYQVFVNQIPISFFYYNYDPPGYIFKTVQKSIDSIPASFTVDLNWFRKQTDYYQTVKHLNNFKKIYLTEKQEIIDNKAWFVEVQFNYRQKE